MAVASNPSRQPTIERAARLGLAWDPLEFRYRAPALGAGTVWRTKLLRRLERARSRPLVVVTAPAGYGKTTLLAQSSARGEVPAAWLTLDEADADPAALADSILTALEWIEIDPARPERDFRLILDDAHRPPPGVVGDAVLDLLKWLPQGSQVVVASRRQPALPFGRMRGHRTLVELGAEELSMSTVEAAALLRGVGLDLEFAAVQELVRRTEGWPVAIELAANSLAAEPDPAQALARLAGDHQQFSEYFRAELLAGLSPTTTRFLTQTSVLDCLSGSLCDAVLDGKRSAAALARLVEDNVPLRAVDASHEWYRVHDLFREMLQTELRRSEPALEHVLHERAGDWYRRAGTRDHAIDHALSAGDLDGVGELLWANLPRYLGEGQNGKVQRWLSGLDAEDLERRCWLALAAANSQLALGDIALAEQSARSAGVALDEDPSADSRAERAAVLIIRAWAARSGAAQMGADAAQAYDLLPDDSHWRASCCYLRGTSELLTGGPEARSHLEDGAARGAPVARDLASLCLAQLAVLALDEGDADFAADLAQRARRMIERHDLDKHPILALVFAVVAAAEADQGRLDQAKDAAVRCAGHADMLEEFTPWHAAETRILLARGLLALGDVSAARAQLAHASRLGRRTADVVVFQRWFDQAWDRFDRRAETALLETASLTRAELRVLRFLPTHFSFHEIAERLDVSANTVKTHVHAVYRKLDASSRSQAVANATRAGLLGC